MLNFEEIARNRKNNKIGLTAREKAEYLQKIENGTLFYDFLQDLKYAVNERGEAVKITKAMAQYCQLLLDYRIPMVICSGAAQIGKSLFAVLCYSWSTSRAGFNTLFLFPQLQSLQRLVPLNHAPIVTNWETRLHAGKKARTPISNSQTVKSLSGAAINYSYSGSKSSENKGASAGTSIVSVSTDALYVDEASQYAGGAIEVAFRRLDNGRIPYKPVRLLGTPGSGGGIETFLKECEYQLYPGVKCPHCDRVALLHPFGGLLKQQEVQLPTGEITNVFLSQNGKPLKWLHGEHQVKDAYISCEHCDGKLDDSVIETAEFYDKYTRESLEGILAQGTPMSISVELSPLLRGNKSVARLIRQGLDTANSSDWCQQALGIPSTFDQTTITREQIAKGFDCPLPTVKINHYYKDDYDSVTVMGVDMGRSGDATAVIRYYFKPGNSKEKVYSNAIREVLFLATVNRGELPQIAQRFNVDTGFIDAKPSIDSSAEICAMIPQLYLSEQIGKQNDDFIERPTRDGGTEYDCIKFAYRKFARSLILLFGFNSEEDGYPLFRFHNDLKGILDDLTDKSPVKQLVSVSFDPETGEIVKPRDKNDHSFFAMHFAEAAFSYYVQREHILDDSNNSDWGWMGQL